MESYTQFRHHVEKKKENAINRGNVFVFNEIEANMFLCSVLILITLISAVCLFLNELGVFCVEKTSMRIAIGITICIQIPIIIINRKYHGEPFWIKYILEGGLLLVCGLLSGILGHNATLASVIPVILSLRYCDVNFTRNIIVTSVVVFLVAELINAFFGIVNLNIIPIENTTFLYINTTLRNAIEYSTINNEKYFMALVKNDYLPKLLIFSTIGFSCVKISQHCRKTIEIQAQISAQSAKEVTESELAAKIQKGMLPCKFPAFPDSKDIDLYAEYVPAKAVGGDFYDFFRIDNTHIAIVIADVSGKGIGAAMFMTISKLIIKNQLISCLSPSVALTEANRQLCENNKAGLFVTVWAGIYDTEAKKITYTNAGHNWPVICTANGKCEYIKNRNGFVLAGIDETTYTESCIAFDKGDEIFLYTDGVTEATNKKDDLYGEDRLLNCLKINMSKNIENQIVSVLDDIRNFTEDSEQFDDITMIGMRI